MGGCCSSSTHLETERAAANTQQKERLVPEKKTKNKKNLKQKNRNHESSEDESDYSSSRAQSISMSGISNSGYSPNPNDGTFSYDTQAKEKLENEWRKAVEGKNNKKIQTLVKQYHKQCNFLRVKWDNGDNSLHMAAKSGNTSLVKFLLLLKMNVKYLYHFVCLFVCRL